MTLSDEDRRRIEEEERVRVEARLRAEAEVRAKLEAEAKQRAAGEQVEQRANGRAKSPSLGEFFKVFFKFVGVCVFLSIAHFVVGGDDTVAGKALGWIAFAAWGLAVLLFYMIPSIVAAGRKHRQIAAIVATNLLLGWIIIGWIIALIWALKPSETAVSQARG